MSNFIANIPMYIGLLFKNIGNFFFDISFKLHIKFNTQVGKALVQMHKELTELAKTMTMDNTGQEDRRLVNILNKKSKLVPTTATIGKKNEGNQ